MIKVTKGNAPPILNDPTTLAAVAAFKDAFTASPNAYRTGKLKFPFDKTIYGAASVKQTLKVAQFNKCAFCEGSVPAVSHGDVEHFRPKSGYKSKAKQKLKYPGYYWLAYSWSNLYFSCQVCNQSGKRNIFPLLNEVARAGDHSLDASLEEPVLLDPAIDDPESHIEFDKERAVPKGGSIRGRDTIAIVDLNRPALVDSRKELYDKAERLVFIVSIGGPAGVIAKGILSDMAATEEMFASMVRCLLRREGLARLIP